MQNIPDLPTALNKLDAKQLLLLIVSLHRTFLGTREEMIQYILDEELVGDARFIHNINDLYKDAKVNYVTEEGNIGDGTIESIDYTRGLVEICYIDISRGVHDLVTIDPCEIWAV